MDTFYSKDLKEANSLMRTGKFSLALYAYEKIKQKNTQLAKLIQANIIISEKRVRDSSEYLNNESNLSRLVDGAILRTFAGIAAIPERVESLRKTVNSLLPQVDQIGIYLNGWDSVPEFLKNEKIKIAGFRAVDLGDAGKFFWVDDFEGIYFTCDDDLIYPINYVQRTVTKLKKYKFKAAVGWHGSLLKEPFSNYYEENSRRVFSFSAHRPWDTPVHILGTGCSAFHTKFFKVARSDFKQTNMADIFYSIKGQEQRMPFYVIEHRGDEIIEYPGTKKSSIYAHSYANVESKKNTYSTQNSYVKEGMPWVLNDFTALSILLIGRFNNFQKGGIYKSCQLIKTHLQGLGHNVFVQDTQADLDLSIPVSIDLCWIYPGDPDRPDFSTVDLKIDRLRKLNIPVIVNLSYLYLSSRTEWIKEKLISYNRGRGAPVFAATFTESAANDPILHDVCKYVCVVPKTIFPDPYDLTPSFAEREGICLGDASKLTNHEVIGGGIYDWIEAIYKRLPHVNLYAYKQYQGKNPHPKITYVPYTTENFGKWLAHRRVFVCLNVHLTFEMVACEAQSYGTPVVYRHMPHSLSEYISATGIAIRSPNEMAEILAWLYNDRTSWGKFSSSSSHNARAKHVDFLDSSLEACLRLVLFRAKEISSL